MDSQFLSSLILLAILSLVLAALISQSPRSPPESTTRGARRALREIEAIGQQARQQLCLRTDDFLRSVEYIVKRREE